MRKFIRTPKPLWFKDDVPHRYRTDLKKIRLHLAEMTQSHCSYCDVFLPLEGELDNFLPKNQYPEQAYQWENLYLVCRTCGMTKYTRYDENLLRPDAEDYSFEKYFIYNLFTGEILPNPRASDENMKKAEVTIQIFGLNREDRCRARYSELHQFQKVYYMLKSNAELKGEKNELQKYNDFLDINRYSYRFAIEQFISTEKQLDNFSKSLENKIVETPKNEDKELARIRVKSITIKDIKCFGEVSIDFDLQNPTNLILGINGRGKTTLLQLLALALQQLDSKILYRKFQNIVRRGQKKGSFSIEFENQIPKLEFEITDQDDIICISGGEDYQQVKNELLILGYGSNRQTANNNESEVDKFECVSSLFGENYLKNIRTAAVATYLKRNFIYIKDLVNKVFESAEKKKGVLLDSFDDYNFYFTTPTNPHLIIPFESLADGYKSVFVWLIDMMIRVVERGYTIYSTEKIKGVVLIDEVDLHLHPAWQRTLMPTLNNLFPNIQFIITTHSPFVVQSLSIKDAIQLTLSKNEVKVKKLKKDGKFDTYKIDEIINQITGAEVGDMTLTDAFVEVLDQLEKAVENNESKQIQSLTKQLKQDLPLNSGFREYIEILTAGLIKK